MRQKSEELGYIFFGMVYIAYVDLNSKIQLRTVKHTYEGENEGTIDIQLWIEMFILQF